MRKVVFGCLGVLVIAAIVSGLAGYHFAYPPARALLAGVDHLQAFPKLNAQVRNQRSFSPPRDGVLTEAMVTRYIEAQQKLHDSMGTRLRELDAKYDALSKANGGHPSLREGLSALQDLGGLLLDAKRAQVDALNGVDFSLAEYDWVRKSVYAASGIPMSIDVEHLIEQASSGRIPTGRDMSEAVTGEVPEKNRELVAPYQKQLKQNAALAFFGL